MIANIQHEYNDHIYTTWQKLSGTARNIFRRRRNQERTYNRISRQSIHFLQQKLNNLEDQDSSQPPKS